MTKEYFSFKTILITVDKSIRIKYNTFVVQKNGIRAEALQILEHFIFKRYYEGVIISAGGNGTFCITEDVYEEK